MNGFLRFVGLMNAALWLGAVVFFSVAVWPAGFSEMEQLLGSTNYPFFSAAFVHVVAERYFLFTGVLAVMALLHLLAEWLYMGRPGRQVSLALLGGLLALVLIGGIWLTPHLKNLHIKHYATNLSRVERESAGRSYRVWHAGLFVINAIMAAGLVVHVWRVANPSDATRFISSMKFRG